MRFGRRSPIRQTAEDSYTDRLPSEDPDIDFDVRVHLTIRTVLSQPSQAVSDAAVILRPILEKATGSMSVLRRDAAQQNININVRRCLPVRNGDYDVIAITAVLGVDPSAIQSARKIQHQKREAYLDELARRQTRARMSFLREECLRDPSSARLFLMLEASPRIGTFPTPEIAKEIAAEITAWRPESRWVRIAMLLSDIVEKSTPSQIREVVMLLSSALATTGKHEQAIQLKELFERGQLDDN